MLDRHAGEIMIPIGEYPHIPYHYTLHQAVEVMVKSELEVDGKKSRPRALLVIDDDRHLLGIIRRRDILRGLEPKFLRTMPVHHRKSIFDIQTDSNLIDLHLGKISEEMKILAEHHISEVMSPISTTVSETDHLAKIVFKTVSRNVDVIVVIKDSKPVGVVRTVDVMNAVGKILDIEE